MDKEKMQKVLEIYCRDENLRTGNMVIRFEKIGQLARELSLLEKELDYETTLRKIEEYNNTFDGAVWWEHESPKHYYECLVDYLTQQKEGE